MQSGIPNIKEKELRFDRTKRRRWRRKRWEERKKQQRQTQKHLNGQATEHHFFVRASNQSEYIKLFF